MKHFSSESIVSEYVQKSTQITKFALCDIFMHTWTNILTLRHEKQIFRLHWLHLKQILKEHAQITLLHQTQYLERICFTCKANLQRACTNNFASPKAILRTHFASPKANLQRACTNNFASPKAIPRMPLLHLKH